MRESMEAQGYSEDKIDYEVNQTMLKGALNNQIGYWSNKLTAAFIESTRVNLVEGVEYMGSKAWDKETMHDWGLDYRTAFATEDIIHLESEDSFGKKIKKDVQLEHFKPGAVYSVKEGVETYYYRTNGGTIEVADSDGEFHPLWKRSIFQDKWIIDGTSLDNEDIKTVVTRTTGQGNNLSTIRRMFDGGDISHTIVKRRPV